MARDRATAATRTDTGTIAAVATAATDALREDAARVDAERVDPQMAAIRGMFS